MSIKYIPHLWIPMPDGAKLGARIWLPEGDKPTPAILEYIPYRKDDYTSPRDAANIAYFATQGYACIRVDMRGSGSSDGVLMDEYSDQEVDDGVSVIEWIAQQDWCNGKVATMGISWGGVTGLQLAQRQPEALKTVIALSASEYRYYDDAGYYIGCMVGQTLGWGAIMFGFNTRPPDPELRDDWYELWMQRLNESPHFIDLWLAHQREDSYWLNNNVACDYQAIKIPMYYISGHVDCWPNTVSRMIENTTTPSRGLQGAWSHRYPHLGIPGPTADFLSDATRWFDHWLKGDENGIMDEATYQVYLQDSVKPQPLYETRPGRWIGEADWPSAQIDDYIFNLTEDGLTLHNTPENNQKSSNQQDLIINSPQTVGMLSGEYMPWFASGPANELPDNQKIEDEGSLVFDFEVTENDLQIVGNAIVNLCLSSDKPQALVAARLCDVWADGESTLITRGILNLSQRNSKASPEKLIVGQNYQVQVKLNHVAYKVPVGHRLRLSLSTSHWPMAWPSPEKTCLTIEPNGSSLNLPIRASTAEDAPLTQFGPTKVGDPAPTTQLKETKQTREIKVDEKTGIHSLEIYADNGNIRFEQNQIEMASTALQRYSISPTDPTSATAEYHWIWEYSRADNWYTKTDTYTKVSCDQEYFYLDAHATAWKGDEEVFSKKWQKKYPRDHF
jgi:putative CocE/NonD family hydrolase